MIESNFSIKFAAALALREKQIQQSYRPVIAVHKWFARRPGTLFRSALLAEFSDEPLEKSFFRSHQLTGLRIADPFMGGGTPLIEANRLGCDVTGCDINPMSYWIVREEIAPIDSNRYKAAAQALRTELEESLGQYYKTRCLACGSLEADVKYFLWVKTQRCRKCREAVDLFPGCLLATDARHPTNVVVCGECGELNSVVDLARPGQCGSCDAALSVAGEAKRGRCPCRHCGEANSYPTAAEPPRHRLFAIEYICHECKSDHAGRFFKKPDSQDHGKVELAEAAWEATQSRFVPDDEIPPGDETNLLHKWGYSRYRELFSSRQLLALETSCRLIAQQPENRIRQALATNLSDLLRYQNMLCRYDTMALKSLDIFSVHGFPVGLIQCESNPLGIVSRKTRVNVGSGGWSNIIEKYVRAKAYCDTPFEIRHDGRRKTKISMPTEWIGDQRRVEFFETAGEESREVALLCESATRISLEPASFDAVVTDPPYFGNVQYAELMDFCYVWLKRLTDPSEPAFQARSTRNADELTENDTMGRGLEHFTDGISAAFRKMALALKPGAPMMFTYHHNAIDAYYPLVVAILDAGLVCTAAIPCPAEMAASIHISGTKSSIVDTLFVTRSASPENLAICGDLGDGARLAEAIWKEIGLLRAGGVKVTAGDRRCIIFGHIARLAIRDLASRWQPDRPTLERLASVAGWITRFDGFAKIDRILSGNETAIAL